MRLLWIVAFATVVGCNGTPPMVDAGGTDGPTLLDMPPAPDTTPPDTAGDSPDVTSLDDGAPDAGSDASDTPDVGTPCDATICGPGSCVDTQTDPNHCGACGIVCPGTATCTAGVCVCPGGGLACGTVCVDPTSDPQNCGACFNRCGSTQICSSRVCTCPTGTTMCGTACADLQRDDLNCGTCGHPCGAGLLCRAGACTSCVGSTATLSTDVQPIFNASCALAGCHTGSMPAEGLNLTAGSTWASTVGVPAMLCAGEPRIVAGDTSNSALLFAVTGVGRCATPRMPQTGPLLTNTQIDTIRTWICTGASNH